MNTRNMAAVNAGGAKLLLVSDLEGCSSAPGQSRVLCSTEFKDAVAAFLVANGGNKVAFLGDYFDQGDLVLESISNIMELYSNHPGKVIIIVGNRDVNKFRLVYELQGQAPAGWNNKKRNTNGNAGSVLYTAPGEGKGWPTWKAFYDGLPTQDTLEKRLTWVLDKSMAAFASKKILLDPSAGDFITASDLLLNIFMKKGTVNVGVSNPKLNAVRNLFRVAKVVHYDPEFKTLLSHAGGMDPFFFHTPAYYTTVCAGLAATTSYYEKIEVARRALMNPPSEAEKASTFVEDTYNAPLKKVVAELLGSELNAPLPASRPTVPSDEFYLLQALGLKPDGGKHFTSFIQSCDNQGCKGPIGSDMPSIYDAAAYGTYQDQLVASGVNVVAAGHSPHCAPVPMIYTRPEGKKIFFIASDTSNGYRPNQVVGKKVTKNVEKTNTNAAGVETKKMVKEDIFVDTVDTFPLAFVESMGAKAGVGRLQGGMITTSTDGFNPNWSFMLGSFTHADAPKFVDSGVSSHVQYSAKKLKFPARPETTIPAIFKAAVYEGGRRKMRKTRKSRKSMRKQKATRRR